MLLSRLPAYTSVSHTWNPMRRYDGGSHNKGSPSSSCNRFGHPLPRRHILHQTQNRRTLMSGKRTSRCVFNPRRWRVTLVRSSARFDTRWWHEECQMPASMLNQAQCSFSHPCRADRPCHRAGCALVVSEPADNNRERPARGSSRPASSGTRYNQTLRIVRLSAGSPGR